MFTKSGIIELHATMHERLDLLLSHVATIPDNVQHKQISGFGHPSIWKQIVDPAFLAGQDMHRLRFKTAFIDGQ
jgi:hypothetical protein